MHELDLVLFVPLVLRRGGGRLQTSTRNSLALVAVTSSPDRPTLDHGSIPACLLTSKD